MLRLIREILYFKPEHHGTNTQVALEYAGKILNRRAVVVVMSDFLDEGFENAFKILRKRHDVLAVSVVDPREMELPPAGLVELEDPETGETLLIDTGDAAFREAFAREAKRQGKATKELFQRMSIDRAHRDPRRLQGNRCPAHRALQAPRESRENVGLTPSFFSTPALRPPNRRSSARESTR